MVLPQSGPAMCCGDEAGSAMRSMSRRALLTSATALWGLRAARAAPALILNDASRLNPVPVAGHAIIRDGDDEREDVDDRERE